MQLTDIKSLLLEHKEVLLSGETKSERLGSVINLLEKANPDVPLSAALDGPIADFVAKANHIEIQPVLQVLRALQSMDSDTLVIGNSASGDVEEIVKYIQQFIAR